MLRGVPVPIGSEFDYSIRHDSIDLRNHGIEFGLYTRWKLAELANVHLVYLSADMVKNAHKRLILIELRHS